MEKINMKNYSINQVFYDINLYNTCLQKNQYGKRAKCTDC